MGMECLNGQVIIMFSSRMDDCLRDSLKMVVLMAKEDTLMKELQGLGSGMTENTRNGWKIGWMKTKLLIWN